MGDVDSSRVSRGRIPLSLEELQDGLHVPLKEVHSAMDLGERFTDLGERFTDNSVVRFKISHYPRFVFTGEIGMTSRHFCCGKTVMVRILFSG